MALLFLLPAVLLVLVFRIGPLFWGFSISLTSATSTSPGELATTSQRRAVGDGWVMVAWKLPCASAPPRARNTS